MGVSEGGVGLAAPLLPYQLWAMVSTCPTDPPPPCYLASWQGLPMGLGAPGWNTGGGHTAPWWRGGRGGARSSGGTTNNKAAHPTTPPRLLHVTAPPHTPKPLPPPPCCCPQMQLTPLSRFIKARSSCLWGGSEPGPVPVLGGGHTWGRDLRVTGAPAPQPSKP